jgi:hypothetical protein
MQLTFRTSYSRIPIRAVLNSEVGFGSGHRDMETWTHGDMETWRQGHMDSWTHGHVDTWTHGHMNTWRHGHMETWRHGDIDVEIRQEHGHNQTGNGKRKPRRFSLIRLPFCHLVNGSLSFVRLLTRKQTEVIRLQTE